VAYTGNGFIVVGNAGVILTSPDGLTWTGETSPTVNSLYGVALARSGNLQGVTVLVGDGGTVVIGGTVPPPPTSAVHGTNCAYSPGTTPALTVQPFTNSYYPPGAVTVDWYDMQTNGTQLATATNSFTPTNAVPGPDGLATNYTYWAEERDLRTGFLSTNRTPVTLRIEPRPTSPMSNGDMTSCAGVANPPLSVTVANRVLVDWYDAPSGGKPVDQQLDDLCASKQGSRYALLLGAGVLRDRVCEHQPDAGCPDTAGLHKFSHDKPGEHQRDS
jgi:hypothetical protein